MKKIKLIAGLLLTLTTINVTAIMASNARTDRPFTNFILYGSHGNNYTATRYKETNNKYSYVKVTELKNTNRANLWIAKNDGTKVSYVYDRGVTNYFTIMNYMFSHGTGKDVRLGMENYEYSTYTGSISGIVDYE